jgi:predicted nucleic acid binding AN1-type Zn finger protein
MPESRHPVTPAELEAAVAVWLRTLRPDVWRRYAEFEKKRLEKRDTEADKVEPRDELAKHIARKLVQAGWEVTQPQRGRLFG